MLRWHNKENFEKELYFSIGIAWWASYKNLRVSPLTETQLTL